MPKRRVPGHLQRTGRRRRDREPNVPPLVHRGASDDEAPSALPGAQPEVVTGRPLRPTQRAAMGVGRFARTAQPSIDMATEYRYVIGDLRQIGVLAAIAFAILAVLTMVIR